MSSYVDVVVIGAGVAGLAAAAAVGADGRSVALLEASSRIGGRAWTVRPPMLGGAHFDMGAIWLHSAAHNPLVPIARDAGETLIDADAIRRRRLFVGGRPASEAERADYEAAWDRYEAAAEQLLAPGQPDLSLAAVARSLPDDPWAVTVETWEGPVIGAAEAAEFSLRDWKSNALEGGNILIGGGLGDFVRRRLAPPENSLQLETPVRRLRWQEAGGGVAVDTPRGTIRAASCIVTVSTGVLSGGSIAFEPALPPMVQDCLHGLPMGLALKVVLRASGPDRLDLPPFASVSKRFERSGDPAVVFSFWPWGYDFASAWIGASTAWELTRAGPAAAADFALGELRSLFGSRVDRAFLPGPALVTEWGSDPLFGGAYAYARPGHAADRRRLGEPLADGRLIFAGEATHPTMAGTVGGAWLSGAAAARATLGAAKG